MHYREDFRSISPLYAFHGILAEISDRVSKLEGAYKHLATKADIANLKGEIASQANKTIIFIVTAIGAAAAALKHLPG